MGHYGLTDEVYVTVKRIICDSVLSCQTSLVEALIAADFEGFTYDDIEGIYPDFSEEIDELESEGSDLEDENTDLENEIEELESELEELENDISDLNIENYEENEDEDEAQFDARINMQIMTKETEIESIKYDIHQKEREKKIKEDRIEEIESEIDDYKSRQEEPQEPLEWWLVDSWLAEKLRRQGEVILDNEYDTWWGRTTSGQSIELDTVMHNIAKSIQR